MIAWFEWVNPSHHRLPLQDALARRLPSHKGHALGIIEDHHRIEFIRLGALHARMCVIAHRLGIDDHDLRAAVRMQSQSHLQARKPCRFEADTDVPPALGQRLEQALVRLRRVVKGHRLEGVPRSGQGNVEGAGTDINAGKSGLGFRHRGLL